MDLSMYTQFVLALVFVLALIGVTAALARRFGLGYASRTAGGKRRLSICEVLPLDGKRKLVLLRRDSTEHLIVLGPSSETVIERAIVASAGGFASVVEATIRGPSPVPAPTLDAPAPYLPLRKHTAPKREGSSGTAQ